MPELTSHAVLCITAGQLDGSTTFEDLSESAHSLYTSDVSHSDDVNFVPPTAIKLESSGIISVSEVLIASIGTGNFSFEFRNLGLGDGAIIFSSIADIGGGNYKNFNIGVTVTSTQYSASVLLFDSSGPTWTYVSFNTSGVTPSSGDHVYFARVSGQLRIYVNGILRGTSACSWNILTADSQQFQIEGAGTSASYIDQVVFWDNANWTTTFTPPPGSYDGRSFGETEFNTPAITLDATGTFPIFGYGEFNTPVPWLSGVGNNPILGYVEFNAPLPSFTAAEMSIGYGEIDTPSITLDATGTNQIFGWAEFNTKRVVLDSVAVNQVLGFCNINTKLVAISAESGGDVQMYTQPVSIDSTGVMAFPGFGEFNTPRPSLTSYGTQSLYATVNMTPQMPRLKSFSVPPSGYEVIKYAR